MPKELRGNDDLEKLFTYQPPGEGDGTRFIAVAKACENAARVIVENVPACADRTTAIRHLVDARMNANMAIALDGQRLIPMG
jgi:hypothetical protein